MYFPTVSPVPVQTVSLLAFISYQSLEGLAYSTIMSSVSALNFVNQLIGAPILSNVFLIKRAMIGLLKQSKSCDTRIPITPDVLLKLCQCLPFVVAEPYKINLFRSMFILAFYGFLRVGEMTVSSTLAFNPNLLQLKNITMSPMGPVSLSFQSFKHQKSNLPFTIHIPDQPGPLSVKNSLSIYLQSRGFHPGPLFMYNNQPVTRSFFISILNQTAKVAQLPPDNIKSHSFRIGAATTALLKGYSHDQIRVMGRWHSDAFKKYIRVQSLVI